MTAPLLSFPEITKPPLILANARIILPETVVHGSLRVQAGRIEAIDDTGGDWQEAIDCQGDFLLPGLVELHTDNLENNLRPRTGVLWPALPALLAHDANLVAAGITTVLDAVALGDLEEDSVRVATTTDVLAAMDRARLLGLLRCDHYLHLRCELAYPSLAELFEPLAQHQQLRLVSLMDHTPGQRQFRDTHQYRRYYARSGVSWSDEEFASLLASRLAQQTRYREPHLQAVLKLSRSLGFPIASHDDSDADHIAEALQHGATVAEFPTTLEAARAARAAGLSIVAGAPNLVRGGSHSGNVAALDLANVGCVDILSSDYLPASLLHAVFRLCDLSGWDLPRAVATASINPARALGFSDRGEIAVGQRADLVRATRLDDNTPVIRAVWVAGRRVG
jgi:alpha-D-ribose 1-methylphosphonate 5-triphosphate diphosphatase